MREKNRNTAAAAPSMNASRHIKNKVNGPASGWMSWYTPSRRMRFIGPPWTTKSHEFPRSQFVRIRVTSLHDQISTARKVSEERGLSTEDSRCVFIQL